MGRREKGPLPVGQATKDKSLLGCNDMAGNGLEWTREIAGIEHRTVPQASPQLDDFVMLRGRSYTNPKPLTFAELRGAIGACHAGQHQDAACSHGAGSREIREGVPDHHALVAGE